MYMKNIFIEGIQGTGKTILMRNFLTFKHVGREITHLWI